MLKDFLRDSAIYGIAGMMVRGMQVLLVPVYTRVLVPADYGVIDMMMIVGVIAGSVFTLEVTSGMARGLADADEPAARAGLISTTLWFTVAATAVFLALSLLAAAPLSDLILGAGWLPVFRVAALAIGVQFIFNALLITLRWDLRAVAYGISSLLFTLVSASAAIAFILWLGTGVEGLFYGMLIGYAVAGAGAAWNLRTRLVWRLDRPQLRVMLLFSVPLVFSQIGVYAAQLTDRVVINALLGLDDLGVFGVGARVASTMAVLLGAFGAALTPLVYDRYREESAPADLARLLRVFLAVMLPLLVGITLFAEEMVRLLATPAYYGAVDVIPMLAIASLCSGTVMFAPGLELVRRTWFVAVIMIITGVENIVLNLVLVPHLGIPGAALATMVSQVTVLVAHFIASNRAYPVPYPWRRIGIAVSVTGAAALASRSSLLSSHGIATLAAKAALLLVALAAIALALLDRRDLGILRDRWRQLRRRFGAR